AEGRAAESPDAGEVAGLSASPADGPRRGESLLAALFRARPRQNSRRLRLTGRAASQSGTARLAGNRIYSHRLGHQSDAEADRHFSGLSPVVESHSRPARKRPRKPPARARPAIPPARGNRP